MYESEEITKTFKALDDEKRLQIISLLKEGEKCACHILEKTNMKQSALSYHMRILCDSKLVNCRQQGKWSHYSLSETGKNRAIEMLNFLIKKKEE